MTEQQPPVLFEERSAGNGYRVGFATLNAERSLNALTLPMVEALHPKLVEWAEDPAIACVVLRGAGDKALCAGGDIVRMYHAMREQPGGPVTFAETFFEKEYRLDYLIHTYEKPILCWGHGIVMGGGIGISVGASHRVVTERSRIAMPEITIGLYPDVAGTWFLNRMPGRVGLFMGLTGASMNAADALYTGLGDYFVTSDRRDALFAGLTEVPWEADPELNHGHLSMLLREHADASRGERPESNVLRHLDLIDHIADNHSVAGILRALQANRGVDEWMETAAATLERGSPTSARVTFEQYRRGRHLSLKETFMRELWMSAQFTRGHDFPEGVRALLVDKDRNPQWDPASIEAVGDDIVERHFHAPRGLEDNPLADL